MKRRRGNAWTSHISYSTGILSNLTYRPILPYRLHFFYGMMAFRQQLLMKTQSYIRLFCASLLGFIFVLLLCLSPLHWVQFRMIKGRDKLLAGLWALCHHHLCWSHVPKAPYYLQISRAFFLISGVIILIAIACLSFYFIKGPRDKNHVDLGISILCFISGACLFLCLILFLLQVKLFSRNVLKPHFLLAYHLTCWASVSYIIVGFISGLNHISSRISGLPQNLLVIPITRTRMERMTLALNRTKTNAGASPQMPKASDRHPWLVGPSGTQSERATQTESDLGNELGIRYGLMAPDMLAIEIEPMVTVDPGPEAERTMENVISGTSSKEHESNETNITNDSDGYIRNSLEHNDDKARSDQI